MTVPLHGTKTHALTDFARGELRRLAAKPLPRQEFNPGVANRLLRGELVTQVMLPSPYKTHKGKPLAHLQITEIGSLTLNQGTEPKQRRFPVRLKGTLTASLKKLAGSLKR